MIPTPLHIIYTEAGLLLSRRQYASWRDIQDEYPTYTTSLGPLTADEVVEHLMDEHAGLHPSAADQVASFVAGGAETHPVTFGG